MPLTDAITTLGAPCCYYPGLRAIAGSVNGAILLSLLLRWTALHGDADGWVHGCARRIEAATGMTRREQETARRTLVDCGIVETRISGSPPELHYLVNMLRLNAYSRENTPISTNGETALIESCSDSSKKEIKSTPPSPLLVHAPIDAAAARVMAAYAEVKPPSHDNSRHAGKRHVLRLLRTRAHTEADLLRAVANYATFCDAHGRELHHRKNAGNFFGREAVFMDFVAADWQPPSGVSAGAYKRVLAAVSSGEIVAARIGGVAWRAVALASGRGFALDVRNGRTPAREVTDADAFAALGPDVEWVKKGQKQ